MNRNTNNLSQYYLLLNIVLVYISQINFVTGENIKNNNVNNTINSIEEKNNNDFYCNDDLCSVKPHVACKNNGTLSVSCPSDAKVIDIRNYHDLIVHIHNKYRNIVALGHLPGYKPAVKMATMSWDDELAKLAELNVKKCIFEHDKCYNTKRFRNTGQCLAGLYYYPPNGRNLNKIITEAIELWFNEHKLINMSYVENFRMEENFVDYGHFLECVVDRNIKVGCAAIQFTDDNYPEFQRVNVACNYASVYSTDHPVYESGKPTSKCKTGKNPKYQGLCSVKEKINPNYYHDYDF